MTNREYPFRSRMLAAYLIVHSVISDLLLLPVVQPVIQYPGLVTEEDHSDL